MNVIPHVLWAIGFCWIITKNRRTLLPPERIICRIHRGTMNGLPELLNQNPFAAFMHADKIFWERSGGYSGLLRRLENSGYYVLLCQYLKASEDLPAGSITNIWKIFLKILGCSVLAVPEGAIRLVFNKIPHIAARAAAKFYWELKITSENLNIDFGKINWNPHA